MDYKEEYNMTISLLNHTLGILTQYPLDEIQKEQITKEIIKLNDYLQGIIKK